MVAVLSNAVPFLNVLWRLETILKTFLLDCTARKKSGFNSSGIYSIDPDGKGLMNVSCDMVTDGGGWTVIQRRVDGTTNFYLNWADYKRGFGSLAGNFWLGNDNIHRLTTSGNTVLRVDMENWNGATAYAVYGKFVVYDESNKYRLRVDDYDQSSTARHALKDNNNEIFCTKDRNSDFRYENPAHTHGGGWWYPSDSDNNLNGRYLGNVVRMDGMYWGNWAGYYKSLKRSELKLRPSSFI